MSAALTKDLWKATTSVSTEHSTDMPRSKLFCASTGSGFQPWSMLATVSSSCFIFVEPSSSPPDRAYVSIRQHTSAYVSIRQHTSAYVSIRASLSLRLHDMCVCVCLCQQSHAYMQLPSPYTPLTDIHRLQNLLHPESVWESAKRVDLNLNFQLESRWSCELELWMLHPFHDIFNNNKIRFTLYHIFLAHVHLLVNLLSLFFTLVRFESLFYQGWPGW